MAADTVFLCFQRSCSGLRDLSLFHKQQRKRWLSLFTLECSPCTLDERITLAFRLHSYADYTKWSHQYEMISSEWKCFINGIWYNQHQTDAFLKRARKWHCIFKKSPCVLVKQKQPIGSVQPETRGPPQRASHRPQSRDTPHVLLIQAGREPQPVIQPFSANTSTQTQTLIILTV